VSALIKLMLKSGPQLQLRSALFRDCYPYRAALFKLYLVTAHYNKY